MQQIEYFLSQMLCVVSSSCDFFKISGPGRNCDAGRVPEAFEILVLCRHEHKIIQGFFYVKSIAGPCRLMLWCSFSSALVWKPQSGEIWVPGLGDVRGKS